MPKVNNIVSTAQSQHAELQSLVGSAASEVDHAAYQGRIADLEDALKQAFAKQEALIAELDAEKDAHQKTQAALAAATAAPTPAPEQPA